MKLALGVAVLMFGGTALAARTGSLPDAAQQRAHTIFSGVGVPPPEPAPSAQVPTGGVTASAAPSPTASPAPARSATPDPSDAATLELCRTWDTARRDKPGAAVPAEIRRALAAAAGGVPEIDEFCTARLGSAPETAEPTGSGKPPGSAKPTSPGTATPGATPTATPSDPGKRKGKGNGNGNAEGSSNDSNSNSNDAHTNSNGSGKRPGK